MPFSDRRTLEIDGDAFSLYLWLAEELKGLDLPQLESLTIKHQGCLPDDRDDDDPISSREGIIDFMYFYNAWRAPNLRSLYFIRLVPAPIRGASIKELSLNILSEYDEMDFAIALQDLSVFLTETPSLQKLYLRTYYRGDTREDQELHFPVVVLENLKSLTFFVEEEREFSGGDPLLTDFVGNLSLPNLSTFSLRVVLEDTSEEEGARDVTELVDGLIPDLGVKPRVQKMSVVVYDRSNKAAMSVPLEKFPSLRSLELGIYGKLCVTPNSTLYPSAKRRSSLEEIILLGCWNGVDEWLSWIVEELRDGGNLERLKVALKGCEFTSEQSLTTLISPGRLEIL